MLEWIVDNPPPNVSTKKVEEHYNTELGTHMVSQGFASRSGRSYHNQYVVF